MLLYIPNENHEYTVFFDTEFNQQKLVQVSMILYERIHYEGIPLYLLSGSINIYIKNYINHFFTNYTGIDQFFLNKNAISELEAKTEIENFLKDVPKDERTLLIAHGIKQDAELLLDLGVEIENMDRYCTYENSKTILNRERNLRLVDICNEAGYFTDQHDAYSDAKNVVHAFSFLKLIEATEK